MKRALITLFVIVLAPVLGQAQINLVHNGSFEDTVECPNMMNEIYLSKYWTGIDTPYTIYDTSAYSFGLSIPELIHDCSSYFGTTHPNNFCFFRTPHFGRAMAQLTMYNNNTDTTFRTYQRDYLQGRLWHSLVAGKQYCVTFYTTIEQASTYAISHIGAYFDDGSIDTIARGRVALVHSMYYPQVFDTSISNDTLHWTKIQGSFTATGIERFITIGNFFEADQVDTIQVHYPSAYASTRARIFSFYLIDDVSVIATDAVADAGPDGLTSPTGDSVWIGNHDGYVPCKWYNSTGTLIDSNIGGFKVKPAATTSYIMELDVCGHVTRDTVVITVAPLSILNYELGIRNVRLYPNPAVDELTIDCDPSFAKAMSGEGSEVVVRDMLGRVVKRDQLRFSDKRSQLSLIGMPPGSYTLCLQDAFGGQYHLRFVKG